VAAVPEEEAQATKDPIPCCTRLAISGAVVMWVESALDRCAFAAATAFVLDQAVLLMILLMMVTFEEENVVSVEQFGGVLPIVHSSAP
jgi:hypothetical protein